MVRLAVISSHPIQYYAPWFQYITDQGLVEIKVFYLDDFGIAERRDFGFSQSVKWDIPLLNGYSFEFVPNESKSPGTSSFWGLKNPSLLRQVSLFQPNAVLMMNYNYASLYRFIWQWPSHIAPLIFRGDSHRLLSVSGLKEKLRRQWISKIYKKFGAALYVGKANKEYFLDHGFAFDQLFFSPHSIDNQRFFSQSNEADHQAKFWKQELGIPATHKVVLFAGKFSEKKRPMDLLKAFLAARLKGVSLLFVGAGPLEAELKAVAAVHPNIYFSPFQNQTAMPRTYAAGDLFVLPSYGNGETWGLAVNEAMCLGRPIIVSDHVGCAQDLIEQEHNGLIFKSGDVDSLSAALKHAFANPECLARWGKASREKIRHYSYQQTTDGLMQALRYISH